MDVLLPLEVIDFTKETRVSESSETIRKRVEEARRKQYERYGKEITNGRVPFELLMEKARLPKGSNFCCSNGHPSINGAIVYKRKSFGWQGPFPI